MTGHRPDAYPERSGAILASLLCMGSAMIVALITGSIAVALLALGFVLVVAILLAA